MNPSERIHAVLSGVRRPDLTREAQVVSHLINPCLAALGWQLTQGVNVEVRLPLTPEKARFWNYSSGHMRRDYVLDRGPLGPLHIEAKHRWPRHTIDLPSFLRAASQDKWVGSEGDGVRKDLALLLWGARSQNATRASVIDDARLLVFDWSEGWRTRAEVDIFDSSSEHVAAAFLLLAPTVSDGQVNCEA